MFLRIEPEFIPFATNLQVETWILLADNDMGSYRILLSETHLICHLTPYLHLRKYLIICKSKEKCSKQILTPVLVEIDNTCRQRLSENQLFVTICYLFHDFYRIVCCCLFPYSTAFILCSIFLTYPLKIEFQFV